MGVIKKMENAEKERIMQKLSKTEPGTQEYRELQSQLGAFTIMDEKRRNGAVTPSDWLKFGGTILSTGLLITADQWAPMIGQKLKLSEFVQKLIK